MKRPVHWLILCSTKIHLLY